MCSCSCGKGEREKKEHDDDDAMRVAAGETCGIIYSVQ